MFKKIHSTNIITDTEHNFVSSDELQTISNTAVSLDTKVDKVQGKQLSSEDYTLAEKNKLNNIQSNAEVNQNTFSIINVDSTIIESSNKTDEITIVSGNNINIDTSQHTITINAVIPDIQLGTMTSGNYVSTIQPGSGINITSEISEGYSPTISHADTSNQTSVTNTNNTVIQSLELDNFGHITNVSSINLSTSISDSINNAVTSVQGSIDLHINNTSNPHSVTKAQLQLANVDNTSDIDKPISTAVQTVLSTKANVSDVYSKSQTDSKISDSINSLVDAAPGALDTLNELAAALGDDPNFASTITSTIANKVQKNELIIPGTSTKIQYDEKGLVLSGTTLSESDIPSLSYSKISGLSADLNNKQPLDADLSAISNLIGTGGLLRKTDTDTWVLDTNSYSTTSGTVTSVSGTSPITSSGGTTPVISIQEANSSSNGYMSSVYASKLDGIEANANNYILPTSVVHDTEASALHSTDALRISGTTLSLYKGDGSFESVTTQDTIYVHPTTDGNLHVPATGTTNNGKVLTAGSSNGSMSWQTPASGVTDHTLLSNIGTRTHSQLESDISLKAPIDNPTFTGTVSGITKSMINLANVDNTADNAKNVLSSTKWSTTRTLTVGNTGKSVDGSGNVSWSLAEIGAQAAGSYQTLDADLTAIAGLAGTSGLLKKTAADTWTLDTSAYTTNLGTITNVTGTVPIVSSGGTTPSISINAATTSTAGSMSADDKTKLDGISIGTTVQSYSDNLTNWAGINTINKQDTLVSGTNIKTINGTSLLGSGNVVIEGSSSSNMFIQETEPVVGVGVQALWIDTSNGDIQFWLKIGE